MNVQTYVRLFLKLGGRGKGRPMGSLFLHHWPDEAGEAVIKGVMLYEYQICMRDMQRTRTFHTRAFLDETQATRDTRPLFTWSLFPPGNLGSLLMNKCMGCWRGMARLLWVTLDDTEPRKVAAANVTHIFIESVIEKNVNRDPNDVSLLVNGRENRNVAL